MGTDRLRLLRRMSDETSVCWIPIRYKTSSDVRQYLLRSVAMRADRLRLRLPRRMSDETSTCWIPIRHKTSSDGEVRVCPSFDSDRQLIGAILTFSHATEQYESIKILSRTITRVFDTVRTLLHVEVSQPVWTLQLRGPSCDNTG